MSPLEALRRFRATATPEPTRAQVREELRQARHCLLRGRADAARPHVDEAHDASQNSPLLHSRAHACRVVLHALDRRPLATVRELPLCLMAAPAAYVRRAAGIRPGQPGGAGLLATWRMRHTLDPSCE